MNINDKDKKNIICNFFQTQSFPESQAHGKPSFEDASYKYYKNTYSSTIQIVNAHLKTFKYKTYVGTIVIL